MNKTNYKIEIRKTCKICHQPIMTKRFRTYCSTKCRQKRNYKKYYEISKNWATKKRGEYAPNKKKCIICGNWYTQVGSHIFAKHHITAREYRETFNLPVKKGIVPQYYKKIKGDIAKENGTYKNLRFGKKFQYKKNDKRAKLKNHYQKGKHFQPNEYYG